MRLNFQGRCFGYVFQCLDDGPPDTNPKVTSIAVVDGETGTVVWEPLSLTEYSNLKVSTTVTLTDSATASSDSEIETVVVVVFAGEICWWLAGENPPVGL
jgi:hypothetical protein